MKFWWEEWNREIYPEVSRPLPNLVQIWIWLKKWCKSAFDQTSDELFIKSTTGNAWKLKSLLSYKKSLLPQFFLLIYSSQGPKRNSSDISCIMIWYDTTIFTDEWEITDKFGTKPYSDGKPAVVDNVQAEISCLIFHQMFFLMRDLVSRQISHQMLF